MDAIVESLKSRLVLQDRSKSSEAKSATRPPLEAKPHEERK